ncbi:hypothetical protein T05_2810 [Trichinella murrelli]|uniref:Uncharacterized protein n=1 Tax=Trichinella murrelli TaxID=144512 RepID=A0A0V0UF18_9BILA|nr:hypothetical protein T05_2810 [Trichinella murrelli]
MVITDPKNKKSTGIFFGINLVMRMCRRNAVRIKCFTPLEPDINGKINLNYEFLKIKLHSLHTDFQPSHGRDGLLFHSIQHLHKVLFAFIDVS